MSHTDKISDEQLNAFVDQQLEAEDRDQLVNATVQDQKLAEEVYSLYQMKELVQQAYRQPPKPQNFVNPLRRRTIVFRWAAVLAMVVITGLSGFHWQQRHEFATHTFYDMATLPAAQLAGKNVIVHVDSNDAKRITAAMQEVESLMNKQAPARVEVVANGAGLILVRKGSPHAARVTTLASHYSNVEFKACGFAMEATRLKEGKPVILVPEAEKVDAALNEILRRLKQGWVYIKA